jgi:poly(hydroxyalkanoate) depolymerase family esterase
MRDFPQILARIRAFRGKFEALIAAARKSAARTRSAPADGPNRLRELTGFGTNPGNLRMFAYAPKRLPRGAPLVIALHGCTQSAAEYDRGTGWSTLADRIGFAVVYPQQQPANNPKNCFSWFLPRDIRRGDGEALSIREMVEHATTAFGSDRRKVFVTGLSAGGAMASVMLATYPEVFAGGAIIAGLPYGCANNVQQAFEAMFAERGHAPRSLGDCVRSASKHPGPWPKISVWHGTSDPIVKPSNGEHIIRQWTDIHGLSDSPSHEGLVEGHRRRIWRDANGKMRIEAFSINGMAHGVPLATATEESCGSAGAFFLDVGISSTHHIARFWNLHESAVESPQVVTAPAIVQTPSKSRSLVVAEAAAEAAPSSAEASRVHTEERQNRYSPNPNAVIAAAFRSAGLPAPEVTPAPNTSHVAPGPIIAAALKAAGLTQR